MAVFFDFGVHKVYKMAERLGCNKYIGFSLSNPNFIKQ
jgi:hypothetical protein